MYYSPILDRKLLTKYLVWDQFLGVTRLVWQGEFSLSSQTSLGKGIFANAPDYINTLLQKCYLVWDNIFLVVDRLVWEGRLSITNQTSLAKGIFTNAPD